MTACLDGPTRKIKLRFLCFSFCALSPVWFLDFFIRLWLEFISAYCSEKLMPVTYSYTDWIEILIEIWIFDLI